MVNSSCGRDTFILDPGQGSMLSRAAILQHRGYYQGKGFSPNFIWYAAEGDRVFPPGSPAQWSGCDVNVPVGQTCTVGQEHFRPVVDAFSDDDHGIPIVLRTLNFGRGFIALTCGNFSTGSDNPVPLISGYKFHDRDRDGVRDPDEPGLAGWTMTLHRDRSDDGQSLGAIATTSTNGDGYYEFRLDGQFPGD